MQPNKRNIRPKIVYPPVPTRKWIPPDQRPKKRRAKPKIEYPPVPTRKWIPPHKRPKKKRKPAYVKPPGINQRLKISSLGKIWHNFRIIDDRTFMLGSFSETHRRFLPRSNGFQTPCNCIIAVTFGKLFEMAKWSTSTINRILKMGDQLYLISIHHSEDRKKTTLQLSEVYASFFLDDIKITMSTKGTVYHGKLFKDFDESPFLSTVIKDFFNDKYTSGIITTQKKHLAFWSDEHAYYLFDPTDHDQLAYPWRGVTGKGHAIVMRFKTTDELVAIIHENINQKINSKFEINPCSIIRTVKVNTKPPDSIKIRHCEDIKPAPEEHAHAKKKAESEPKGEGAEEEEEEAEEVVVEVTEMEQDNLQEEIEEYSPEVGRPPPQTEEAEGAVKEDQEQPVIFERKKITPSMIPLERIKVESVTYFAAIVDGLVEILRASTHQGDPHFNSYRGQQSVANAVAALTMLRLHRSRLWIREILDQVMLLGEQIHAASLRELSKEDTLKVSTVCKKIVLDGRTFAPDVEEFTIVGRLQSDRLDILDLLPALKEFFRNYDTCIVTGPLVLALWKECGKYYLFDPNERDQNGLVIIKSVQIGSELRVTDHPPGVACVMQFEYLKDLVEIYMYNVERRLRREPFVLSRVQINDFVSIPRPWYNFQGLTDQKWILRGSFNQNDRMFEKQSRNTQCTSAALMALAYSRIRSPKQMTTSNVDEILLQGDLLHRTTVASLVENKKFVESKLRLDELPKKITLEDSEIIIDVQECLINGLLDAKDENDALNLKKAFEMFFIDNEMAILTTRSISVAIWKDSSIYYYYDSHSRDESGIINDCGTACILRMLSIEDLVGAIEANLFSNSNNVFNISRIDMKVWGRTEDGVVRQPLNNYTEVNSLTAILRALLHARSPEFKLNGGKQIVPMCLVAAAMTKLYPPAMWSSGIIDEILRVGDQLYTDTLVKRSKATNLPEDQDIDEVKADNCLREFKIGLNKFSVVYGEALEGEFGLLFRDAMVQFLEAPEKDENHQKELLVTTDLYTVLIWQDRGVFYLFDPKPRDEKGEVYGKEDWSIIDIAEEEEDPYLYTDIDKLLVAAKLGAGDFEEVPDSPRNESLMNISAEKIGSSSQNLDVFHEPRQQCDWKAEEDAHGRACTMWFTTMEKLIKHMVENVPETKWNAIKFKLIPLKIFNRIELSKVFDPDQGGKREDYYSGSWYEFQEIVYGQWILRGTMDYTHIMFPPHNRGKQSVAMCYAVLAYVKRFVISTFKPLTVDDILKYGDRLLSATRNICFRSLKDNKQLGLSDEEIEERLDGQTWGIDEVERSFCIGPDQMNVDITPDVIRGEIHAYDTSNVFNVKTGLQSLFEYNNAGILVAKNLIVAVWKGVKMYYMFDPRSRGPSGIQCVNGTACITRYLDLAILTDVFLKNLPKGGSNFFCIHQVAILIVACPRELKPEEKERPDVRPKFNSYNMVVPGKSILRGTMNQEDPRFGRGRNVQSAPIAIIALTMTLIHKASLWTKPIIDEILILGDELYVATLDRLGFEYNPWEQGMTIHLVNKDYKMGTLKANCELRATDQRGIIDIKHPKVPNLRQGIEKFFEENTHGVIETETLTVAIWEEEEQPGTIYMYDPNPRSPTGFYMQGGFACVMAFESAKLAAEHFIGNIYDKSKRSGEFVITPVEIVVGTAKTKRKEPCPSVRKPTKKDGAVKAASRPPTQDDKKKMKNIAAQKRAKKEAERSARLAKFEYHALPNGDAILRGSKSQTWAGYSITSQNNQDIPNCLAAFVVHHMVPISNWHFKHIDLSLDVGDQLYKDSYITYDPKDPKLGFKNVLRKIFIKDVRVSLKVYKPVLTSLLTAFNLEMALANYFHQEFFGILTVTNQHVALLFKEGYYYVFDPHDRDGEGNKCPSGCACVMRFQTLQNLAAKCLSNMTDVVDTAKIFTITLVTIGSITKNGALDKI